MFIRKTKIKTGPQGEPYYTYRLVESVRIGKAVKQRTVINLGKHFAIAPEHWPIFTARIEQLLSAQVGQTALFNLNDDVNISLEESAQRYAALIIQKQSRPIEIPSTQKGAGDSAPCTDFQTIDLQRLNVLQARTIGAETLLYQAMTQLQLQQKLSGLGFNSLELSAAIGTLIGRAVHPASERETHRWLQQNSALGELIQHDFSSTSLTRLYKVADKLLDNQKAIEDFLCYQEQDIFQLNRTLVLYDLTNTYFEGRAMGNPKAKFGRSKEKRSDCPLVTLGLVLDGDGFPLRSRIFSGNASEPKTLKEMIEGLSHVALNTQATVILDAGIATQENIDWLVEKNYTYIVVSRQRYKETPSLTEGAVMIKSDPDNQVIAKRVDCPETGEVKLYCHSSAREKTDRGIRNRFEERFEQKLSTLNDGLSKKGCTKKYDKIVERIGKLKENNPRVASSYTIKIIPDDKKETVLSIEWTKTKTASEKDKQAGVYCLRTNQIKWDEVELWQTYVMLTEIEATFRSLKTDLGLRPVYHQKESRVTAHLFISLLAYHLVHTLRYQLKKKGIDLSWTSIRNQMSAQQRMTVSVPTQEGDQIHLRVTSQAEPHQQRIYEALAFSADPIGKKKTTIKGDVENM